MSMAGWVISVRRSFFSASFFSSSVASSRTNTMPVSVCPMSSFMMASAWSKVSLITAYLLYMSLNIFTYWEPCPGNRSAVLPGFALFSFRCSPKKMPLFASISHFFGSLIASAAASSLARQSSIDSHESAAITLFPALAGLAAAATSLSRMLNPSPCNFDFTKALSSPILRITCSRESPPITIVSASIFFLSPADRAYFPSVISSFMSVSDSSSCLNFSSCDVNDCVCVWIDRVCVGNGRDRSLPGTNSGMPFVPASSSSAM